MGNYKTIGKNLSSLIVLNITQTENPQVNILIVDDTPDNLDLLAAILQKRGYQTFCAVNGSEALEIAKSGWVELILLDIQMPGMSIKFTLKHGYCRL